MKQVPLFNSWILVDKKFKNIEDAKSEVEKMVNKGISLSTLKIVKECEPVKVRVIGAAESKIKICEVNGVLCSHCNPACNDWIYKKEE